MTSKRLAEIREAVRHDAPVVALLGGRGVYLAQLLDHVDHLTAENARLTKGMSRLHASVEIWHGTISRDRADSLIRDALRALLNPPTEGEADHE